MALVTFVDDNPPYLNAQNLNNNFQPHAITIGLSTNFTQSGSGGHIIPLDTQMSKVGSKLSFDSTNNCIVVGSGVDYIEISGGVMQSSNTTGLFGFFITKNGIALVNALSVDFSYLPTANQLFKQSSSPIMVSVSEGDKIYLVGYGPTGGSIATYEAYSGRSNYLTARVIS